MKNFPESILESRFSKDLTKGSVLGVLRKLTPQPIPDLELGRAWKKQAPNGRIYYKMKFNCFLTASGKGLYAKAWSRKKEPNVFDVFAHLDSNELPLRRHPQYFR